MQPHQEGSIRGMGVNLYDGRIYGPGGEGFIRINVGCPCALLQEALQRLAIALSQV